ncbi:MAG: LytR C-terminal domain-containing protein [Telluria sp.]
MSHYMLRTSLAAALLLQGCITAVPPAQGVRPALLLSHSTSEAAEAFYQLGRQHHEQGNLEVAMTGYTYAIARDPRHLAARSAAAAIHARQGRLDQARAMLAAVVADYPAQSQPYNNLGYLDYLRGDRASAVSAIRQALVLDPRNERARNNLALAEARLAGQAPPVPAAVAMPAPPVPATVHPGQLMLVQVLTNVYELRRPTGPASGPVAAPLAAPRTRVEVANGDGTAGLARRVGSLLGQHGFTVARLTNLRPYGLRTTRIAYRPGQREHADAMRQLIDGPVQIAQEPLVHADIRLVLGADTRRALARQDAGKAASRLAAR